MIRKRMNWATFRVVVQRRGLALYESPSLSRFAWGWITGSKGWKCIVGLLSSSVCLPW